MAEAGDASQMALVRGSARFVVDKVILFAKLQLFSKNPALLAQREYEVQSDVSSSVLSTFVEVIGRTEFDITADKVDGLAALSEELGHLRLAAACRAFRSSVVSNPVGETHEALMREIEAVRERQELSLFTLCEEMRSLRQLMSVSEARRSEVLRERQEGQEQEVGYSNHRLGTAVSEVKQEVGSLGELIGALGEEVLKLKEQAELNGSWRTEIEGEVVGLKRSVSGEVGRWVSVLKGEIESIVELRGRIGGEVSALRQEMQLIGSVSEGTVRAVEGLKKETGIIGVWRTGIEGEVSEMKQTFCRK
jgi:hypothetical protein